MTSPARSPSVVQRHQLVAITVPSIAALVLAVVGRAPPTSAVGTRPGRLAGGSTSTLHRTLTTRSL